MSAAFIRILLRYAAAALVARGLVSVEDGSTLATDPDVQFVIGLGIGVVTEGWYWLAKRLGWAT